MLNAPIVATVESVTCAGDERLHLAPREPRLGVSVYTLCLRTWKDREHARIGMEFCAECIAKFAVSVEKEPMRC